MEAHWHAQRRVSITQRASNGGQWHVTSDGTRAILSHWSFPPLILMHQRTVRTQLRCWLLKKRGGGLAYISCSKREKWCNTVATGPAVLTPWSLYPHFVVKVAIQPVASPGDPGERASHGARRPSRLHCTHLPASSRRNTLSARWLEVNPLPLSTRGLCAKEKTSRSADKRRADGGPCCLSEAVHPAERWWGAKELTSRSKQQRHASLLKATALCVRARARVCAQAPNFIPWWWVVLLMFSGTLQPITFNCSRRLHIFLCNAFLISNIMSQ